MEKLNLGLSVCLTWCIEMQKEKRKKKSVMAAYVLVLLFSRWIYAYCAVYSKSESFGRPMTNDIANDE